MNDLATLKEPVFIEANWEQIYSEIARTYELIAGVPLTKGQLEAVILSIYAYRENILRIAMNEIAKQNLLAYAKGVNLDHLGALLGIKRLSASKARTTLRFSFVEPLPYPLLIPKGTQIATRDEKVVFQTVKDVEAPQGAEYIEVEAEAETPGSIGNGYMPGDISILLDPLPFVDKVENISVSFGGLDEEDDEHFRERIWRAPEAFSNAGSKGAYEFWARSAHQDIVDVYVESPSPGVVRVYPLLKNGGIPTQEILSRVAEVLSDEKVRPLTDFVEVLPPQERRYSIRAQLYLYQPYSSLASAIQEQAISVLQKYAEKLAQRLGHDVVPEQIVAELQKITGVYRAVLIEPAYIEVSPSEVAKCENIEVVVAGVVNE